MHLPLQMSLAAPRAIFAHPNNTKSISVADKSLDSIETLHSSEYLLNSTKAVTVNTMSTTVKSPSLSQSSSREANFCTSGRQNPSQRPRGASAFNAPLSDLDLAGTLNPSVPQSAMNSNENYTYSHNQSASIASTMQRPGSLIRLIQGQDTAGARRPGSSMEALRRGSAQQTAAISNTHEHPLSPTVVDPNDLLSWGDTATQAAQLPQPLSTQSSKFSLISIDEISGGGAFHASQPSAALMSSSLNDPDPFVSQGRGRRATAPAEGIAQYRPKSSPTKGAKSRESLGSPNAWQEPLIPRLANNPTDGALTSTAPAFPTFVPTRIGPPAFTSSFNGGPTNHQLSQALGAASVASVGSGSTGSSRERSRSHSPAREFVRNYLKTTTSSSASVTPTNQSPSVQRLMAMTSTVAQTIRANVASAVNASGAAGATSTGLANAATNLLLGANYGGSNNALHHAAGVDIANSSAATRKQSVMHDRHLLDTSVPDGLADKVASQPSLKPSFSTSTASTDAASSNRQLSSSHLSETITPANPLAVRRLSCAAPKDKILPSDWPARSDQLALTMDMLLEDTRAIVSEINTSLEAAEQDNLAVGVKLATARTKLRSLVAWEATSTQAVVGWLNMAVSRHKQIEREVKDWGSRPASPKRGLIGEDLAVEEVGLVDSGQSEMEHSSKTTNEHSERQAETTAAFELFDQTMTPSDFSLASRSSPEYSLNASGNSAIVDSSTH